MTETLGAPKAPLNRIVREGTSGDCPECHSTILRKYEWGIFGRWGRKLGCLQPECGNYHNSPKNKRTNKLDELGM